jgi:hypothetical protein
MPAIRIPSEHWGKVWRALLAYGPVSRVSREPVYLVTEQQVRALRRRKLPFEQVALSDDHSQDERHGENGKPI